MKSLLISLIFFLFQSEQQDQYFFFSIDESIPMENISFGKKETGRRNRVIKVKSGKEIKFQLNVENHKYDFAVAGRSILRLNTITLEKLAEDTGQTMEIARGDVILVSDNPKNEKTNFKVKVACFGEFLLKDQLTTKSEKLNNDLKENPEFFDKYGL